MEIEKYIKDKKNIYKVLIDGQEYKLYDDTIVKFSLMPHKNISKEELKNILDYNLKLDSYYLSIKYINTKLRSEKEIKNYLKKHNIDEQTIDNTIILLKNNNYLNEDIYINSYIHDAINLKNEGPYKITSDLIELGLDENKINNYIDNIDDNIWSDNIKKYIEKKIKLNHKDSSIRLKNKIISNLLKQGYSKEMIINILNKYDIIDDEILEKEINKVKEELSKKYSGSELKRKVSEKLYRKGFVISDWSDFDEE